MLKTISAWAYNAQTNETFREDVTYDTLMVDKKQGEMIKRELNIRVDTLNVAPKRTVWGYISGAYDKKT